MVGEGLKKSGQNKKSEADQVLQQIAEKYDPNKKK